MSTKLVYAYTGTFVPSQPNDPPVFGPEIPLEQSITYQNWDGAILQTTTKTWQDPSLLTDETTQLGTGSSAPTSDVHYTYYPKAQGSQLQEKDEYDFGAGAKGPLLRKTTYNYASFPATPIFPSGPSIFDRPSSAVTYDGNNNRVAETDYSYDQTPVGSVSNLPVGTHDETNYGPSSTAPRGNATTMTKQCFVGSTTCTNPVTTLTYDETGQLLTTEDPCGNATCSDMTGSNHTTQYSYADSYTVLSGGQNVAYTPTSNTNAYLTKTTDALGHTENFTYDFNNGQLTILKDQNSQTTTHLYNDSFARPTQTTFPDGGKSTTSYNDSPYNPSTPSPSATTSQAVTSSTNLTSLVAFDGLGHTVRSTLTSDPDCSTGDRIDTTYDGLGRVNTTSNPYCSTSDPTYGLTTHTYDALGRAAQVIPPDGSATSNNISTTYSGSCAVVVDQAGKVRKSCTDGLGRLVELDEPSASGASAGTPGTGTVKISGHEQKIINCTAPVGATQTASTQTSCPYLYDGGSVSVTVNGFTGTAYYGQNSTEDTIATALGSALNGPASPVSASASANVITLTARTNGSATNYPLSTSVTWDSGDFSGPSFVATLSGPTLTGGSDGITNPLTTLYTYDTLDNLLTVTQKGGSTDSTQWRPRTLAYDSLSRLTSSTNPESNTVPSTGATLPTTYLYDVNGNLSSKTAPAPNQTGSATVTSDFLYDPLNRVTQKSFSDGTTPTVKYGYDGVALSGCAVAPPALTDPYPAGLRTAMCDGAGAESWGHDNMGRVVTDRRTTNGITKPTAYTYLPYVDGSLYQLTYPSSRIITYATGTAGRLFSVQDNSTSVYYATSAHYIPSGALSSLTNGTSLISTLYHNTRLQPCRISVKSSGTAPSNCADTTNTGNVLDFAYGFNFGSADNGNVVFIANNKDNTRSQNFTYDFLNRLATAQTQTTGVTIPNSNCWGLTFGYDPWGNLLSSAISGPSGCSEPLALNVYATKNNQLSASATQQTGYCYDSAGNLLDQATCPANPPHAYVYNAENQLISAGGVTYSYDGDGRRVMKSSGTLYWYGTSSDPLDETDLAGDTNNSSFFEYVFFGSKRIARRDYQNNVNYYFADHLGTSRVVTNSSGAILDDSDFYPFGGERPISSSSGNHYKFTGKERDAESGLDNFGARYNSSALGRFMSADPFTVTPGRVVDPQQLNLYAYVRNNPLRHIDPTGMVIDDAACLQDMKHCSNDWQKVQAIANQQDKNGNYLHPELHNILNTLQSDSRTFVLENSKLSPGTAGEFTITNFTANGQDFTRATLQLDFKQIKGISGVTASDLVPGFNKYQGLLNAPIDRLAETFGHEGAHGLFSIDNPAEAVGIQQLLNQRDAAMQGQHYPYPPDVMQKIDAAEKGLIPTERFAQQEEKIVNGELQADKKKQ